MQLILAVADKYMYTGIFNADWATKGVLILPRACSFYK